MPPLPIPTTSHSNKGKQTRYPVYAPPAPLTAAAAKAEKKRAIVPSKPLRSPSLVYTERSPLLLSASAPSASAPIHRYHDYKPGQSSKDPNPTTIIVERRASHGSAPLSSSPLAKSSFISPSNHERQQPEPTATIRQVSKPPPKRKPFYRPRPLWLVPFAILAAIVRGMTLAPRVEIYTQLACLSSAPGTSVPPITVPDHEPPAKRRKTEQLASGWTPDSAISLYASLDPMGPHLYPAPELQRVSWALPPPKASRRRTNTTLSHLSSLSSLSSPSPDSEDPDLTESDLSTTRRPTPCSSSPTTQARAARLQTLMTTTTGLLSALSTSFWGRFSSTHGRTRVLAIATLGLLTTDLVFVLVASPSLPWPLSSLPLPTIPENWVQYKQYLLLLGPLVEGSLGGWTTLQSTASAYLSDCTSAGGRAGVFARFTGVFYVGFSVGPVVGGAVVRYFAEGGAIGGFLSNGRGGLDGMGSGEGRTAGTAQESVTAVFWVAVVCSFVNFLLVLFVFPESLDKVRAQAASSSSLAPSSSSSSSPSSSPSLLDNVSTKGKAPASPSLSLLHATQPTQTQPTTPHTPISTRHPIFPIVEDVEVGGGDGFVDVDDVPSPVTSSPSGSGFLPSRGVYSSYSPVKAGSSSDSTTPLLLDAGHSRTRVPGRASPNATPSARKGTGTGLLSTLSTLLTPLRVFLPVQHLAPTRNMLHLRYATDWSLTLLAVGLVGWMLSTGIYQIKYLYAGHVYGWGVRELSGYVGWMGFVRAVVLLWVVPEGVAYLKGRAARVDDEGYGSKSSKYPEEEAEEAEGEGEHGENKGRKQKMTRLQLGKSIAFDLKLARASLFVDFVSNVLIAVTPAPSFHSSVAFLRVIRGESDFSPSEHSDFASTSGRHTTITHAQSQAMFVAASSLSALGGGLVPAVHSLALCIVQARGVEPELSGFSRDVEELVCGSGSGYGSGKGSGKAHYNDIPPSSYDDDFDSESEANGVEAPHKRKRKQLTLQQPVDAATLLSAFAVLQALSQSILAPLLFGFLYAETVQSTNSSTTAAAAAAPKMVFVLAAGLLLASLVVVCAVRNPVGEVRAVRRERRIREGLERVGRARGLGNGGGGGGGQGQGGEVALSVKQSVGGGGVKACLVSSASTSGSTSTSTSTPGAKTTGKAVPPSLNLPHLPPHFHPNSNSHLHPNAQSSSQSQAKPQATPMPIVKRWERDMGRRGRSVVSKDLRGGAVSVSASASFSGGSGVGSSASLGGPMSERPSEGTVSAGPSSYTLRPSVDGRQVPVYYGSLPGTRGCRGYGSVSVSGSVGTSGSGSVGARNSA